MIPQGTPVATCSARWHAAASSLDAARIPRRHRERPRTPPRGPRWTRAPTPAGRSTTERLPRRLPGRPAAPPAPVRRRRRTGPTPALTTAGSSLPSAASSTTLSVAPDIERAHDDAAVGSRTGRDQAIPVDRNRQHEALVVVRVSRRSGSPGPGALNGAAPSPRAAAVEPARYVPSPARPRGSAHGGQSSGSHEAARADRPSLLRSLRSRLSISARSSAVELDVRRPRASRRAVTGVGHRRSPPSRPALASTHATASAATLHAVPFGDRPEPLHECEVPATAWAPVNADARRRQSSGASRSSPRG